MPTPNDTFSDSSRRDLSNDTLFEVGTLFVAEKLGLENRFRGCLILCQIRYTTPPVSRRTQHQSSPDNMRYNGMAHSYRSSRCEAISTLAVRRYAWPCWDGVPEGGVAYNAYKLIYDTARLSAHTTSIVTRQRALQPHGPQLSYRSSRCEAIYTLAARRYVYPCWDGVPEGGVAYNACKLIYDTVHHSAHTTSIVTRQRALQPHGPQLSFKPL